MRTSFALLKRSQQGAVAAEFMIAFMPLMTAFLCFTQMAQAYTAGIVMRHATTVVARYASVVEGCIPHHAEAREGNGEGEYMNAAKAALGPWANRVSVTGLKVSYAGGSGTECTKPFGDVTTSVTFKYRCSVPLGRNIFCQGSQLTKEIKTVSPNHGACYQMDALGDTAGASGLLGTKASGKNCGGKGSGY